MDFSDNPTEAAYRARARTWLEANALSREEIAVNPVAAARKWQALKAAGGFACISWAREWGGPGGTPIEQIIFAEEEAAFPIPENIFMIGLGMCLPTVLTFADEATKQRFAAPGLRGDEIWCQLFSEPGAGSDLAAVRTRATPSEDGSGDWIVNGQKIWTSKAHLADYAILLCRTDPGLPKHKGMTMFWLDMRSPGVDIVPITRMNGIPGFNEVFFTDVRIPDCQRLGEVGGGWKAAVTTLGHERLAVGGTSGAGWDELLAYARSERDRGRNFLTDGEFRSRFVDLYLAREGLRHTRNRTVTALSRGQVPGPENSISKVVGARFMMDLSRLALDAMGCAGVIAEGPDAEAAGRFQDLFLTSPGARIAGGTDEIMKNIISERVLGLPADTQPDRNKPFDQISN